MSHYGKYSLLLAAGLVLVACTAKQDPVSGVETGLCAVEFAPEVVETRSAYFAGATLQDQLSGDYMPMFVSATAHTAAGTTQVIATGEKFTRAATTPFNYKPANTLYWPSSATLDCVAYAGFADAPASNPTVTWNNTDPSKGVSFAFDDTLGASTDLLWAASYGNERLYDAIPMRFNHAMACIQIEISAPAEAVGRLTLDSIEGSTGSEKIKLGGTFTVDNTYVLPVGRWSSLSVGTPNGVLYTGPMSFTTTGETSIIDSPAGPAKTGIYVPFVRVFVPEQNRCSFVVSYTLGTTSAEKVVNISVGTWEAGGFYTYRLEFPTSMFP